MPTLRLHAFAAAWTLRRRRRLTTRVPPLHATTRCAERSVLPVFRQLTSFLALQLEATVSRLTAELASSREAAEGLRRDLRAAQADGEGRDRQHDASTRDLRKELRDCDETIGCVAAKRAPLHHLHLMFPAVSGLCASSCVLRRRRRRPVHQTWRRTWPSSPSCVRSLQRAAASLRALHATRRRLTRCPWRRRIRWCFRLLSALLRKRRRRLRPRHALLPSRVPRSRMLMLQRQRPKRCAALVATLQL